MPSYLGLSESEASKEIKRLGSVKNRFEEVIDISTQNPKEMLMFSISSIKWGVSDFVSEPMLRFRHEDNDNLPFLINAGKRLGADLAGSGSIQLKESDRQLSRETDGYDLNAVLTLYQDIRSNFLWNNGHSTEVVDQELATFFLVRLQLQQQSEMIRQFLAKNS